jgi:hypothetical protein
MSTARKVMLGVVTVALFVFLAPVLWSAVGTHGYFEGYRCVCGFQSCCYIEGNAFWSYSPGHGRRTCLFALHPTDGQWEALDGKGEVICTLRVKGADLLEKYKSAKDWQRHRRVYNIWRVWVEGLMASGDIGEPLPLRPAMTTNHLPTSAR